MTLLSKQTVLVVAALGLAGAGALAAFVASGTYGIGADDPHTAPVSALLARVRDNAVAARARTLTPPAGWRRSSLPACTASAPTIRTPRRWRTC